MILHGAFKKEEKFSQRGTRLDIYRRGIYAHILMEISRHPMLMKQNINSKHTKKTNKHTLVHTKK